MPVVTLQITGPADSGKTEVANHIATALQPVKPYYLRVDAVRPSQPSLRLNQPLPLMKEARRLLVDPGSIYQPISDAIGAIATTDPNAVIIVENDNEPCFRAAYPYHIKCFVIPGAAESELFRTQEEVATAIRQTMEDTGAFTTAVFGIEAGPGDSSILPATDSVATADAEVPDDDEVQEFLESDIGYEIAGRMRLRDPFQAIIESELVVLNDGRRPWTQDELASAKRLHTLCTSMNQRLERHCYFVPMTRSTDEDRKNKYSLSNTALRLIAAAQNSPL